jgi:hypothetical protein
LGFIGLYHEVFFALWVFIVVLLAYKYRSILPLSIIVAGFFGIEDATFYLLQLKLPSTYLGVEVLGVWQPPRSMVLFINTFGLLIILLMWVADISRVERGVVTHEKLPA